MVIRQEHIFKISTNVGHNENKHNLFVYCGHNSKLADESSNHMISKFCWIMSILEINNDNLDYIKPCGLYWKECHPSTFMAYVIHIYVHLWSKKKDMIT